MSNALPSITTIKSATRTHIVTRMLLPHLKYLLLFLTTLFYPVISHAENFDQHEYSLKAVFLERFTRFIDWPETKMPEHDNQSFVIAVIGNPQFANLLSDIYQKKKIKGKQVIIQNIDQIEKMDNPNLLYIAPHSNQKLSVILEQARRIPVLTIADTDGFAKKGVMINFYMSKKNKIRFEINERAIKDSGLHISYKLLSVAKIVQSE